MSRQVVKLDLVKDNVPILSKSIGQTSFIQGLGSNVMQSGKNPQVAFVENALPTMYGFKSFGFTNKITAALANFDEIYRVQDSTGAIGFLSPCFGAVKLLKQGATAWVSPGNTIATTSHLSSVATYANTSYYCEVKNGVSALYLVNVATNSLTLIATPAITGLLGVTASSNYLIAWSNQTIYWSSTVNPTDFTPSLITGAGSAIPTDLHGSIIACYPVTNGFLICTTEGILSAQYSGNATYPWVFKAVAGGVPIINYETITHSMVDGNQIAYTAAGVLTVDANQAVQSDAELSDFLKSSYLETFNSGLGYPVLSTTSPKLVKLTRIGDRYLCCSVGVATTFPQVYTHCYIYDLLLRRTGKMVKNHTEVFDYPYAMSGQAIQPAILSANGSIDVLDFNAAGTHPSVLIQGRIAITRNSTITVQQVVTESCTSLSLIPLLDAVTPSTPVPLTETATGSGYWSSRVTAKAHSILIQGTFDLSYLEIILQPAGSR